MARPPSPGSGRGSRLCSLGHSLGSATSSCLQPPGPCAAFCGSLHPVLGSVNRPLLKLSVTCLGILIVWDPDMQIGESPAQEAECGRSCSPPPTAQPRLLDGEAHWAGSQGRQVWSSSQVRPRASPLPCRGPVCTVCSRRACLYWEAHILGTRIWCPDGACIYKSPAH